MTSIAFKVGCSRKRHQRMLADCSATIVRVLDVLAVRWVFTQYSFTPRHPCCAFHNDSMMCASSTCLWEKVVLLAFCGDEQEMSSGDTSCGCSRAQQNESNNPLPQYLDLFSGPRCYSLELQCGPQLHVYHDCSVVRPAPVVVTVCPAPNAAQTVPVGVLTVGII